jgi:hypothetical protein
LLFPVQNEPIDHKIYFKNRKWFYSVGYRLNRGLGIMGSIICVGANVDEERGDQTEENTKANSSSWLDVSTPGKCR